MTPFRIQTQNKYERPGAKIERKIKWCQADVYLVGNWCIFCSLDKKILLEYNVKKGKIKSIDNIRCPT